MGVTDKHINFYTKFTIVSRTPLNKKPSILSDAYCYIPKGRLVHYNGEAGVTSEYSWVEVMYNHEGKSIVGWIPAFMVEPFTPSLEGYNIVSHKRDLEIHGMANFENMGERVALFCSKNYTALPNFKTMHGKSSTLKEIESMLHEFKGYPEVFTRVQDAFTFPNGKLLFTAYKASEQLRENKIVLASSLERDYGRLTWYGARGWIVLTKVVPEARSGIATIYNSATNSMEHYSWVDLIGSVGERPQGIIVPI